MWEIATAKSNDRTLIYNNIFVHSRINPKQEASQFIKKTIGMDFHYWNIMIGIGLGYHIDVYYRELKTHLQDFKILCVFSSPEENTMFYQVFPEYQSNKHIICILATDFLKLQDYLNLYFTDISNMGRIKIVEYYPIIHLHKDTFTLFQSKIKEILDYGLQTFATVLEFNKIWIRNFLMNLKAFQTKQKKIEIMGDIILVAAGFSVVQNLDYLKEQKGKIPIAVVDTILPTLYAAGIIPDIIIACDGQVDNYYDFLCLVEEPLFLKKHKVILLADITVFPKIVELFDSIYFSSSEDMIITWQEYFLGNQERSIQAAGGSVASFALSVLYSLGAQRIILIGQDLQNKPLSHSVQTIHHLRQIYSAQRFYPFFNTVKKWLSYTSSQIAQDGMLRNLTIWIADFFRIFKVEGLHKDPSTPIRGLKIWDGEILKGSIQISALEQRNNIQVKLGSILELIDSFLNLDTYKEWISLESCLGSVERRLLQEFLIKLDLSRMRNLVFNEKLFLSKGKKNLRQLRKWICRELKYF